MIPVLPFLFSLRAITFSPLPLLPILQRDQTSPTVLIMMAKPPFPLQVIRWLMGSIPRAATII